jgi:hypothetical protein
VKNRVRHVAILIPASPTPAFYSQLAVFSLSIQRLEWFRWKATIHVYLGGPEDPDTRSRWDPYLRDLAISTTEGDWATTDDRFRFAPRDADVILAMDADTLPVASFESLLDEIVDRDTVCGVIAHYPPFSPQSFDLQTGFFRSQSDRPLLPAASLKEVWNALARPLINRPLNFSFSHSLLGPDTPPAQSSAPFYVNFGVVFFSRAAFDRVTPYYLAILPLVVDRLPHSNFSGQVALTLAIANAQCNVRALPMRYNFPNDAIGEDLYPKEIAHIVVWHYLRTNEFDRQRVSAGLKLRRLRRF